MHSHLPRPTVGEVVQRAIRQLKDVPGISRSNIQFKPWTDIRASGQAAHRLNHPEHRQSKGLQAESMAKRITVFYAFPSAPPTVGEVVQRAIRQLKDVPGISRSNIQFKPWTDIRASGKLLIGSITQNIDRAKVFACDLTYLNRNVTFELGYAIGTFKRIWTSLDTSIQNSERDYKRVYFNLLGMGYAPYQNHKELFNALQAEAPWFDITTTLLGEGYRDRPGRPERPTLLYVQPPLDTESVIAVKEALQSSLFGDSLIADDPRENPSPTLDWYAEKLLTADAVLVQLLSNDQSGNDTHNIKGSFIDGLAYGFRKPLFMTAQTPFESPVDYGQLLTIHETSQQCATFVKQWIGEVGAGLPRRRPRRPVGEATLTTALDIRALSIGEPVAEHERHKIDDFFVETDSYYRALEGPTTILVGRKGTGKTAILFAMQATLGRDRNCHVCVMKPVGYEIHGPIRVLDEIRHQSERGYLIESLWKYLVYSELALSVQRSIMERPNYLPTSEEEVTFLGYCENNKDILDLPFSERLDTAVKSLKGIGELTGALQQRARISERLHEEQLRDLRKHLGLSACRQGASSNPD